MRIVTDNIERARFTETGLFGLGTASPTATFDLYGSFRYRNGSEQPGYFLATDANGNSNWQQVPFTSHWTLSNNNNLSYTLGAVSIGTDVPLGTFTVAGPSYFAGDVTVNGVLSVIKLVNADTIGVGPGTPTTTFDVFGDARITGNLETGNFNTQQITASDRITTPRILSPDSVLRIGPNSILFNQFSNNIRGDVANVDFKGLGLGQIAFGKGLASTAIGRLVETAPNATEAVIIGSGILNAGTPMINNRPYTLMVGFNSDKYTLFVSGGDGTLGSFGRVGIGTDPQTTFHVNGIIRTDGTRMIINNFNGNGNFWFRTAASEPESVFMSFIGTPNTLGGPAQAVHIQPGGGTDIGLYVDNNKNVGIGTSSPDGAALVVETDANMNTKGALFTNSSGARIFLVPKLSGWGYNDVSQAGDVGLFWSDNLGLNPDDGAGFVIAPHNTTEKGFRIDASGKVGIGLIGIPKADLHVGGKVIIGSDGILLNTVHDDYQLAVKGKIVAKQMHTTVSFWSDYKLKNGYSLMPWKKQEAYFITKGHLFGVPSEKEVLKNGINLGEMDAVLLGKLEEAYLYIGELNKENKNQQQQIEILEKEKENLNSLYQALEERVSKIENK